MSANPYLFIVGCSRSGTTLLQQMTDAHRSLAIVPETRWFARWWEKRYGVDDEGRVTPDLVERLLAKHRLFRDVGVGITKEELLELAERGVQYADFVSHVLDRYGEARGRPLVGNKTPGYVRRIPVLRELWPRVRFVHLVRDGRDVFVSARSWRKYPKLAQRFPTWSDDPAGTAALWWEWDVRLGREAGAEAGPDVYYEMRYEDLVAGPEGMCRDLCGFLDLPYDEAMVRHHEGRVRGDERAAVKHPNLIRPVTAGLRDWRDDMDPREMERFEAVAGGLLDELGYERAFPRPSEEALAAAARLRARFDKQPVPRRWGDHEDPRPGALLPVRSEPLAS